MYDIQATDRVSIGVNITAFGREIPLFECDPAFQLQCPAFLRISH